MRFEQAVKSGDAAGGELAGTYPNPLVGKLFGQPLAAATPVAGNVIAFNGTAWAPAAPGSGGVTSHGALTGLLNDDHPQYLLTDGTRALTGDLSFGGFKLTNLAAASANGEAVRFEQAVKSGDAAAGDLAGNFPALSVVRLRGIDVALTSPTAGQVLTFNGTAWVPGTSGSGGVTDHGALTGLADDDHPQYLLADGTRATTNGFAVTGGFNTGAIPASGPGTRLMWYPGKAAFRAGRVDASQWDDVNVGQNSTALGGSSASGDASTASGGGNATGYASTAMGGGLASGNWSVSLGNNTLASGFSSTALGTATIASGASSFAIGFSTTASANSSRRDGRLGLHQHASRRVRVRRFFEVWCDEFRSYGRGG